MAESTPPKPSKENEPSEILGPLTVERHVKDDGRALILYARRPDRETIEGPPGVEGPPRIEGTPGVEGPPGASTAAPLAHEDRA